MIHIPGETHGERDEFADAKVQEAQPCQAEFQETDLGEYSVLIEGGCLRITVMVAGERARGNTIPLWPHAQVWYGTLPKFLMTCF